MLSPIGNNPSPQTTLPPAPVARDRDGDGDADVARAARPQTGATTQRLSAASVSESTSADLRIVTQQGDTVTLHASLDTSATYAGLRSRGPSGRLDANSLAVSAQQSLSVNVDGNLDAKEQADIDQLVKRIGADLKSFLAGKGGATGAEANGLSSIAGFQVHFEHTETVTAVSLVRRVPTAPVTAPAAGDAGTLKPAPAPVPVAPATPVTLAGGDIRDLVQRLLQSGRSAQHGMSSFAHLANAARRAIDAVAKDHGGAAPGGIFDQLRAALDALRAPATPAASAPVDPTAAPVPVVPATVAA